MIRPCSGSARLADIYVNDAFAASHRSHASIVGVPEHLPAVAGLLLAREIDTFTRILRNPDRPFAAIIGGAKVGDKLGVLENIIPRVDLLIIGGGMAATFLASRGYGVGASAVETDRLDDVREVTVRAAERGVRLLCPGPIVRRVLMPRSRQVVHHRCPGRQCRRHRPHRDEFAGLGHCRTVVWNGPMGVFEFRSGGRAGRRNPREPRRHHDHRRRLDRRCSDKNSLADRMTHVSTGGLRSRCLGEALPGEGSDAEGP